MKNIIIYLIIIAFLIGPIPVMEGSSNIHTSIIGKYGHITNDLFDEQMLELMKQGHIPSLSACIVHNDDIVWEKGYGKYDISSDLLADTDTIYMTASISKTITATALMQLYDKGLFELDEDINSYLPLSIRNPKYPDVPITFRMLLSHRSSFTCNLLSSEDYSKNIFFKNFLYLGHLKDILTSFYPDEFYPWLKEVIVPNGSLYDSDYWGDYPPGEQSSYTGIGFILIGYLIEILSNQSFESYCKDNIFIPLHMNDTIFTINDLDNDRLAVSYLWFGGFYFPIQHYEYGCYNPASGLRTTVQDLSHFLIAHMNNGLYHDVRILNESTAIEMHQIQYPGVGYGLGFEVGRIGLDGTIGHWGRNVGFISHMFFSPSKDIGIIYFYNEYSPNSALFFGDYLGFTPNEGEARYEIPLILWEKANQV